MYSPLLENHRVGVKDSTTGTVRWLCPATFDDVSGIRIDGNEVAVPDGNGRHTIYDADTGAVLRSGV